LQGRNGDAGVEDGLVDTGGEEEKGTKGESRVSIYTPPGVRRQLARSCCAADGAQPVALG